MIRVEPCDEPSACGGEKRSKQTTSAPRFVNLHEAAAPMTPPPLTALLAPGADRDLFRALEIWHHDVPDLGAHELSLKARHAPPAATPPEARHAPPAATPPPPHDMGRTLYAIDTTSSRSSSQ